MKEIKYFIQIVAAIAYSCFFTGLVYIAITYPLAYIISLAWWKMLLFLLFFGGILEAIIGMLGVLVIAPFAWIVKKNSVAKYVSICIIIANFGLNIVHTWKAVWGYGFWAFVFGLVVTFLLLQFIFVSVAGISSSFTYSLEEE